MSMESNRGFLRCSFRKKGIMRIDAIVKRKNAMVKGVSERRRSFITTGEELKRVAVRIIVRTNLNRLESIACIIACGCEPL